MTLARHYWPVGSATNREIQLSPEADRIIKTDVFNLNEMKVKNENLGINLLFADSFLPYKLSLIGSFILSRFR